MKNEPIILEVDGRAIATCKCKQRTFITGLLYLIEIKRERDEVKSTNMAVRSCPRCNQYLDPKGMERVTA